MISPGKPHDHPRTRPRNTYKLPSHLVALATCPYPSVRHCRGTRAGRWVDYDSAREPKYTTPLDTFARAVGDSKRAGIEFHVNGGSVMTNDNDLKDDSRLDDPSRHTSTMYTPQSRNAESSYPTHESDDPLKLHHRCPRPWSAPLDPFRLLLAGLLEMLVVVKHESPCVSSKRARAIRRAMSDAPGSLRGRRA